MSGKSTKPVLLPRRAVLAAIRKERERWVTRYFNATGDDFEGGMRAIQALDELRDAVRRMRP